VRLRKSNTRIRPGGGASSASGSKTTPTIAERENKPLLRGSPTIEEQFSTTEKGPDTIWVAS